MDNINLKCKENCKHPSDDRQPSSCRKWEKCSDASSRRMAVKMSTKMQRSATPPKSQDVVNAAGNDNDSKNRKHDEGNNIRDVDIAKPSTTNTLKKKAIVAVVLTALKPNNGSILSPKGLTRKTNKTKSCAPKVDPNNDIAHPMNASCSTMFTICPGVADNVCQCIGPELAQGGDTTMMVSSWLTSKRINELRVMALDAAKRHKTFTIRGCYYSIRRGLQQRGWVERLDVHRRQTTGVGGNTDEMPERKLGESKRVHIMKCERNIMSRFLEHKPIDFLWAARKERTDWEDMTLNPAMQISRFHKKPFTSKSGMCAVMRDFHWFFEEGTAEMYYPRCYNVFNADDLDEFVENFRMSACVALLRLLCERRQLASSGAPNADAVSPVVPPSTIHFAIEQCRKFVRFRHHDDIDDASAEWMPRDDRGQQHEWELLLRHHKQLTTEGARLVVTDAKVQSAAQCILADVAVLWPQYSLDGWHNIWIVKPSNRCRGRGIRLMNDLQQIKEVVNPPAVGRWVVQKYIERPLIIHNCKFDIRQWFLITSVQPLVIWMYRESYLRFSTQEFSLLDFHESVHLTNHAVQKRYRANGQRDQRLPKDNMWDSDTFQLYLRQIGADNAWQERIYPGMKRALIGTLLASQDLMDRRVNTFELFGADFMVTEDYQPWLLEINSSPDLAASTSVTSRLCPQCLDDVVKVVVDYRANPKAATGQFELVYKQSIPSAPAYLGLDLYLTGTQITPFRNQTKKVFTRSPQKRTPHPNNSGVLNLDLANKSFQIDVLDVLKNRPTTSVTSPNNDRRSSLIRARAGKPPLVPVRPLTVDTRPKVRRYRTPVVSLKSTVGHHERSTTTNMHQQSRTTTAAHISTVLQQQHRQLMRNGSRALSLRVKLFKAIDPNQKNMQCVGKSYDHRTKALNMVGAPLINTTQVADQHNSITAIGVAQSAESSKRNIISECVRKEKLRNVSHVRSNVDMLK